MSLQAKWLDIGPVTQIEPGMAATLPVEGGDEIAVFHTMRGEFYALVNKCPHKAGPLSQGIVHGDSVTCPLHNWRISLRSGEAPRHEADRLVPARPLAVDLGMEQPALEPERLAEVGAFRAQLAMVGRVHGIAGDFDRAFTGDGRGDTASDPAIGAGGADRRH